MISVPTCTIYLHYESEEICVMAELAEFGLDTLYCEYAYGVLPGNTGKLSHICSFSLVDVVFSTK